MSTKRSVGARTLIPWAALRSNPLEEGKMAALCSTGARPLVPCAALRARPLEDAQVACLGGDLARVRGQIEVGMSARPDEKKKAVGPDEGVHVGVLAIVAVVSATTGAAGGGGASQLAAHKRGGGKFARDKRKEGASEGIALVDDERQQFDVEIGDGLFVGVGHVSDARLAQKTTRSVEVLFRRVQRGAARPWRCISPKQSAMIGLFFFLPMLFTLVMTGKKKKKKKGRGHVQRWEKKTGHACFPLRVATLEGGGAQR